MKMKTFFHMLLMPLALVFAGFLSQASAQYGDWKHSGWMYLVTTSAAKNLSYVRGGKWKQDQAIIWGSNGIAALTFCEVPIRLPKD